MKSVLFRIVVVAAACLFAAVALLAAERAAGAAPKAGQAPVPSPQPVAVADAATQTAIEEACRKIRDAFGNPPKHPRLLHHNNTKLSAYHVNDRWLITKEEFEAWTDYKAGSDYWKQNLEQVVAIDRQLREAGIELIVLIVPPRVMVYPELIPEFREILKKYGSKPVLVRNAHVEFVEAMQKAGVNAIDLYTLFLANRGRYNADHSDVDLPLYGGHGQHWAPYGAYVAAQLIRQSVKDRQWYKQAKKVPVAYEWAAVEGDRALARQHGLHKGQGPFQNREFYRSYGPARITVEQGDYNDNTSPVAVTGDSFIGAGQFDDNVNAALAIPAPEFGKAQQYNTASVSRLVKPLSDPQFAKAKRLVVWEMNSLETMQRFGSIRFTIAEKGTVPPANPKAGYGPWDPAAAGKSVASAAPPTGERPAPAAAQASQPAAAKAPRSVVEARLVEATQLGKRLTDTIYPNCLAEYVYEVQRVVEGDAGLAKGRISVLHWVLNDFQPQQSILDRKTGQTYRLVIEPFAAHKAFHGQRQETTVESPGEAPWLDVAQEAPKLEY